MCSAVIARPISLRVTPAVYNALKIRSSDADGTTTHCFYRQLESTVWNRGGNSVVVLSVSEWISKKYGRPGD